MKRQQRLETSGPLSGHVREGRRLLSPLAATGVLTIGDWVRDDFPDLLWPFLVLAESGSRSAVGFAHWQKSVQHDLEGVVDARSLAVGLDGRLTSLDRLVAEVSDSAEIIRARAAEHGLLPEGVMRALASYPRRPAEFLTAREFARPGQADIDLIAKAIIEAVTDRHREAIVKCLPIWSAVQAGILSTDQATIDLLVHYPNDEAIRSQADTAIRAMWGARRSAELLREPGRHELALRWAKTFWRFNSVTTSCMRTEELHSDLSEVSGAREEHTGGIVQPGGMPEGGLDLRRRAMDLTSSYMEALETVPVTDLYGQERQEVHAGLVTRAGREVLTILGAPDLWCMEFGSHINRMLVEIRVHLDWMARQPPAIYRTYQEYGAGKAKLYSRIVDEMKLDWMRPKIKEATQEFEKLSHNDSLVDHRVVDTRDSFAGTSLRAMAEECGLLDLYRRVYYISSGVTHSEWWSIELNALERCQNIMHRGHLIPSLSLPAAGNVELAKSWVETLYALIHLSLAILDTDKDVVAKAFSWLDGDDTPASASDTND